MSSEVIPEAAVEAAAKAFRETHDMGDALMNALEAAAPHMLADAWDEGERAAFDSIDGANRTNPYRPTP
ncbi:hypothetical protein PV761_03300 [Arthrobacter sp. CC3]|uniref:hypothetical protein n=1 Tax=Arthrobacter sp. CC3 TaxID=3029185 RepID=UPI003266310A